MTSSSPAVSSEVEAFFGELEAASLSPLWTQYRKLLPAQPGSASTPHVWRYEQARKLLMRAGELVDHKDAIRRSLNLVNPTAGRVTAVGHLYAALQLVKPGEVAPSHRHAAAAMRFIIEGSGGFTSVNGERAIMTPGDLVLTPSFAWHDHGNETDEPMIWLDGLDLPLLTALETSFYEADSSDAQSLSRPDDASTRAWGQPALAPRWESWELPYSPVIKYPWDVTERALLGAAQDTQGSPTDGVIFEYVNPVTCGPVMSTIACFAQLLHPGQTTQAHRQTCSTVYHAVRGNGATVIDGERIEWSEHDTFVVPIWAEHHHENLSGDDPAFLFSFSDAPVQRSLGLYREELSA